MAIPTAQPWKKPFSQMSTIPAAAQPATAEKPQAIQAFAQPSTNYQEMSAPDQFKYFQANPDVGRAEIARATNQTNLYKASGDTDKYNAGMDWLGKVNTVMSGIPAPAQSAPTATPNPYQQQHQQTTRQYNDTFNELQNQMKTPFVYDPNTDQQAVAYKKVYDNLAKEGSRNAMESLNDRGILNSSITAGEVADAEQNAQLQYGAKIADLGSQAYQRNQDQIGNTGKLLGFIGQQQQQAQQGDQWDKTFDRGVLESDRTYNRQVKGDELESLRYADETTYKRKQDAIKNGQWDQQFELDMQKWADDKGLKWANFDLDTKKTIANIALDQERNAISQQNANTSAASAANSAGNASDRLKWDKDPNNPDNQYKMAQIGKAQNQSQVSSKDSADNYTMIYGDLQTQGVTKDKAKQLAQSNRDYLSDADYKKLLDYIEKQF